MSQPTLEAWVSFHCPSFGRDVSTHIDELTDLDQEKKESLWRAIMTSVRQHWEGESR